MKIGFKTVCLSIIFVIGFFSYTDFVYAEEDKDPVKDVLEEMLSPNLFGDLVGVVMNDSTEITEEEAPFDNLMDIIGSYYADETVDDRTQLNVLAFLSNAYSGHGFYDTGYWGKPEKKNIPYYTGPLPESKPEDFYRPVWGIITSGYGYRPSFGRVHKGIDLSLQVGDTVRAALPGVVTYVSYDAGGYGNYVVLAHSDGLETRYGHLSYSLVSPGKTVVAGEAIALGGNTGNSTGPHLHFETRYRGIPIDPRTLFDFNSRSFGRDAKAGKK